MEKQLIEWRNDILLLESYFETVPPFLRKKNKKGKKFASVFLMASFNHLRNARMFMGDLLRLQQLQEKHREQAARWLPPKLEIKNDPFEKSLSYAIANDTMGEDEYIKIFKQELRAIFYEVIDYRFDLSNEKFSKNEFQMYWVRASAELKMADQQLGLRLGELN